MIVADVNLERREKWNFGNQGYISAMKTRRTRSLTRHHKARLSSEEFASLKQLADKPRQVTIPAGHRDRLIEAGYVREVLPRWNDISTLVLTGTGLRRVESGE